MNLKCKLLQFIIEKKTYKKCGHLFLHLLLEIIKHSTYYIQVMVFSFVLIIMNRDYFISRYQIISEDIYFKTVLKLILEVGGWGAFLLKTLKSAWVISSNNRRMCIYIYTKIKNHIYQQRCTHLWTISSLRSTFVMGIFQVNKYFLC